MTEIEANISGRIWLKKHGTGWEETEHILPEARRLSALNNMANLLGKVINERTPDLSGELPLTGDRIQGSIPPSSEPCFFIRRHAPQVFTLEDYVRDGILEQWQAELLRAHVLSKSNIVFSGATDSGKTTIANACLALIGPEEHVVIIEDTHELQCEAPHFNRFKAGESPYTMLDQIKNTMRRAPDRIVIGETRDHAGLALLKAWTTGHTGGITTVHAKSASRVFDRFAQFCEEAGVPAQWRLMRSALDLICHMEKTENGRRMTEIIEVQKEDETDAMLVPFRRLGPQHAVDSQLTSGGEQHDRQATVGNGGRGVAVRRVDRSSLRGEHGSGNSRDFGPGNQGGEHV